MATALRLFANRDLAAQYWGEAKRLLFQLQMRMQTAGIDQGAFSGSYPDGTVISIRRIFGVNQIEIISPFPPPAQLPRPQKSFYILCYRSDTLKKFYSLIISGNSIEVLEADISLALNIIQLSSATVMTILEDTEPTAYVIEYGLSFADWLKHQTTLSIPGQNKGYDDRFLYCDRGSSSIRQFPNPRFIESFLAQSGRSYRTAYYYYPKLTAPETIEWTKALHADYGISADIKGKNNITLNETKTFATSWGERIHDSAAASYSFYTNYMMGEITDPWYGEPANILLDSFLWPIITTFSPIKKPRIYTLQYQADDGSHETPLFSETLNWSDNYTFPNWPNIRPMTQSLAGSILQYWPIAAMGDRKALFLKNAFTVGGSSEVTETSLGNETAGSYERTGTGDRTDHLTQEFYAGDFLIDSGESSAGLSWNDHLLSVWDTNVPSSSYSYNYESSLNANLCWIEPLDYFNHQGNLIVFYKKITETLLVSRTREESGPTQYEFSYTAELSATSTRTVEYYMAWKFGDASGKDLLATFTLEQTSQMTDSGSTGAPGTPTHSFSLSASGERIYGISCQLTESLGVFSFNKEIFNGIGAGNYDKKYVLSLGGITDLYASWFSVGEAALAYPFPLEDGNNIIDGPYAWTGAFCVGAIAIAIPETDIGTFGFGEFNNQTDIVAATGIVAKEE